jgi:hypothetical protein
MDAPAGDNLFPDDATSIPSAFRGRDACRQDRARSDCYRSMCAEILAEFDGASDWYEICGSGDIDAGKKMPSRGMAKGHAAENFLPLYCSIERQRIVAIRLYIARRLRRCVLTWFDIKMRRYRVAMYRRRTVLAHRRRAVRPPRECWYSTQLSRITIAFSGHCLDWRNLAVDSHWSIHLRENDKLLAEQEKKPPDEWRLIPLSLRCRVSRYTPTRSIIDATHRA